MQGVAASTPAGAGELTQHIEWLGIRMAVPDDWQVVRHGLAAAAGRLVFVDRRRERCSLVWTQCPSPPSLGRLVNDARGLAASSGPGSSFTSLAPSDRWQGFREVQTTGEVITRAIHWDASGARLLELVTTSRGDAAQAEDLAARVAASVACVAPPERARRWRAFDLDVTAPDGFRLVGVDARPADATFRFRSLDAQGKHFGPHDTEVRRRGMADAWHDGDLDRLARSLAWQGPCKRTVRSSSSSAAELLAEGTEAGPRWRGLFSLLRTQKVRIWSSATENAVYSVTIRSPARQPIGLEAFEVRWGGGDS